MNRRIARGFGVMACATLMTALAGWGERAHSAMPMAVSRSLLLHFIPSGLPVVPVLPKPFTIPAQPIVPASSDGYLPSSWTVTPKGEFTIALPIAVPPGRAGMEPALSLNYASGTGNGIAGVGWSVSGISRITRGGRAWARHGAADGVDYTARDRFYLDGQELVGVDATPYGGNGAEYRTVSDTFVRVHSTSALAQDPLGPEQFTVEMGDGRTRTYAAVTAEQVTFDKDNQVFAHGPVRVAWRLMCEQDASGNAVQYAYEDSAGPGGSNAADYWYDERPSKILYTANLTNGLPTHGLQDLAQRYVQLEYEDRPDASSAWQAGVQRHYGSRLKSMRMYAPNPTATAEVWRYDLSYTLSGSERSVLSAVQRCESAGGCLWAKHFAYSPASSLPSFQEQPVVPEPIPASTYDFSWSAAPDGELPAMQLLDLNGDGASDLLFGPGTGMVWEHIQVANQDPPFDIKRTGAFLGGSHSLWLSQRNGSGDIVPLSQGLTIPRDEVPLATANYGHVRLDEATVADIDGDGRDELVAAIDNLEARELAVDPKALPLKPCSFADLQWTGSGFVHQHAMSCTLVGSLTDDYHYYLPNELPLMVDLNGDGLVDRVQPYNAAGWVGSNNPNDIPQFEYSPGWKVAFNQVGAPGQFATATKYDKQEASPGVVTDLNGDGRAELTSEALKSALTLDDDGQWIKQVPDSVHLPTGPFGTLEGFREFGDVNGDGLEDLVRLSQSDPAQPGLRTAQVFWNTGRGFYPDSHVRTVEVDVHPDWSQQVRTRYADAGIRMTDVNQDGRLDLVIFNNDHKGGAANNQPTPQIVFLLSQGDGTFTEMDRPVTRPGTRNDVKYWLDNALRPLRFYPTRLENDIHRMGVSLFAAPQSLPDEIDLPDPNDQGEKGRKVQLNGIPFQDYEVPGSNEQTPGFASGWNLATLSDVNGDGALDIVRHVGGNDASGGFEVLQQTPAWGDELVEVTDEATAWPAVSVTYSSEWSDRPEVNDSYECTYPLHCPKSGLRVVREVTSRNGLTDLKFGEDPLQHGHTWEYSYRDPVASLQGLGFFGFSEVRTWDTEPTHPVETITTFDLRTPDATGAVYPGVGVPATVTVAQPILQPGQGKVASAPARLTRATSTYELRWLNGGATHVVVPQATHTSEWEEPVAIAWNGQGPDHLHVAGYAEPAQPPIQVDAQFTVDDYGNVIHTTTQTAFGLKTEVSTPRLNDMANWHLGLISERTAMQWESQKNAVPTSQTTVYTYTSLGQVDTIGVEPNHPDPAIPATTKLSYDDYGLLSSATTTAANEVPRTRHLDYTNAWPGAPDEHLYASIAWAEHDNPVCGVDCRPAAWMLIHPAYGLPVATMDRNGVETVRTYDGHGRPVIMKTDGELPVNVTYAGRADAFGGMNGLQISTTSGLQQVLRTLDARGATLRNSFGGFDGQWVNTFMTYDALGRPVGVSRPNAGTANAWTSVAYDSLGRAVETVYPDSSSETSTYSLLGAEHIDAAGHYSYRLVDVDGRLITSGTQVPPAPGCGVCLAQDVKTTFQYSATSIGPVAIALDDQGHATKTQYDRRHRPIQQDEPTRGTTKATYNGFGETTATVHVASGQTQTHTHDDLGRIVTTTSPDGLTTYSWDTAPHGIGQLARATSPDQIKAEYRYDTLGRTIGIDQTDELLLTASIDFQYDPQTGRLASIDYPKAPGQAARFKAAYDYNGYGYLKSISDATPNQPALVLQQITVRNADLSLVDATRGVAVGAAGDAITDHRDYDPLMGRVWSITATHAGVNRLAVAYNYDADGLVNQRTTTDEDVQIDETFEHDALHRLTHTSRNGMPLHAGLPFSTSVEETYDSVGNRIDTLRNGQLTEHRSYTNAAQPYALTERSISDLANPNQPPQIQKYEYDSLGRLKQDAHRALTWTPFDLPRTLTQDGKTWTFRYGPANERVKKIGPNETITSLAGLYEKHDDGHQRQHVFHVIGGDDPVADVTYTESGRPTQPGTTQVRYPLTDALGSSYAVADAAGTVSEHDYFDSWGLRTNPDGTPMANLSLFHSAMSGGYTNQEHDDDVQLVNMQGRMYDPILGRFLSPDPIVAHPAFSQSWNGYSYVLNSPLNFTDPSGFEPCPTGYECTTGPNNEIENTIHTPIGGAGASDAEPTIRISSGAATMLQDMIALAKQRQELVAAKSHAVDGIPKRTPDGTPILMHWANPRRGNAEMDNWGVITMRGNRGQRIASPYYYGKSEPPTNDNGMLAQRAADFAVRLGCGSKCASASAPTNAREAAQAPKQLSDAQIARNAISQALAARAVVKFLGKVGVMIDEGIDGIVDRLTPDFELGTKPLTIEEKLANAQARADEALEKLQAAFHSQHEAFMLYHANANTVDAATEEILLANLLRARMQWDEAMAAHKRAVNALMRAHEKYTH